MHPNGLVIGQGKAALLSNAGKGLGILGDQRLTKLTEEAMSLGSRVEGG
jgi:hypothetical protein